MIDVDYNIYKMVLEENMKLIVENHNQKETYKHLKELYEVALKDYDEVTKRIDKAIEELEKLKEKLEEEEREIERLNDKLSLIKGIIRTPRTLDSSLAYAMVKTQIENVLGSEKE